MLINLRKYLNKVFNAKSIVTFRITIERILKIPHHTFVFLCFHECNCHILSDKSNRLDHKCLFVASIKYENFQPATVQNSKHIIHGTH